MKRTYLAGLALLTALALSGCGGHSPPRPEPDTPPNDPRQVQIQTMQVLGALSCAALAGELKPAELGKAKHANDAVRAILLEPNPSLLALTVAISETGLPPSYALLSSLAIQQLKVILGNSDVLPTDTTAWAMAVAYFDACAGGLATSV